MARPYKDPNRPCPDCKRTPTETNFRTLYPTNIYKAPYRDKYCEECRRQRQRNKTKNHAYKDGWLRRRYGIDLAQYEMILKSQNGLCAICHLPQNEECLVVDHCHETEKVRGLVHSSCNKALGLLKDNPIFFLHAAIYLLRATR